MATKVLKCKCEHEFQDKEHGKGMRVHTVGEKNDDYRCTVCGKSNKQYTVSLYQNEEL